MFQLDGFDREVAEELQESLPDKIFDAHAHPFIKEEIDLSVAPILGEMPDRGGLGFWRESLSAYVGESRVRGGLFFGLPVIPFDNMNDRIKRVNNFLIDELRDCDAENSRGLLLISNMSDPGETESLLDEKHIVGFKPYRGLNPECGTEADIKEYLPEWACKIADKRGLIIMLHIGKLKALNDEGNIKEINDLCARFPGMKLILAHAGYGLNMYNTIKGCLKLNKADNLWFDTSVICEAPAITALLKSFGPKRLLWGSDFPVSLRKGRYVTLGNTFYGLQGDTVKNPISNGILLGIESLRAVLHAANDCRLNSGDIEDVFCNNAIDLIGSSG